MGFAEERVLSTRVRKSVVSCIMKLGNSDDGGLTEV